MAGTRGTARLAVAPPARDHAIATVADARRAVLAPAGPPAHRPSSRCAVVPRERLVRALAGPSDVPLRAIVAPAGYGKTIALEQWAARDPRPFAWVTAGAAHDDPARLLAAVVVALDEIEPLDDLVLTALMQPWPAIATEGLPRLGASLAARNTPFVLVIDEADAVTRPDALQALAAIPGVLPRRCVLAIASRREPALPLGRLRVREEVVELRARALAMTHGEARALLGATGLDLDAGQLDMLVERTEGWPAGLHLAAMALREADDVAAGIARFAGDDRLVADYLRDELLSPLTAAQRAFLTRTSPLEELSGPLCDAVLLQRGSGAVLRDLSRSNVLLFALDRSEERFHCNPLLAQALRAELRRLEPDREAEIHRRAAAWHEARGDVEAAIDHALAAGDPARAGQLIWRVVPAYSGYGRNATVERWLSRFTDDELARHPELALAAATVHMTRGDRDLIELLASNAEASAGTAPDDRRDGLDAGVAIMRAVVAREGLAGMRDDAARAYALEPEHSAWRALCRLLEGTARLFSGDAAGGRERLEEGARRGAMAAPGVQVLCQALLSLRALIEEDWEEGARLAELARAQVERVQLREYATCAPVYAVSALARAHRGHADQARDDVRDARRLLARLHGFTPVFEGATILALARAELRLSDVMGARTLLAEGERVARSTPDAVVLRAWLDDAWARADAFVDDAVAGPSSLTTAELRVLSFLPTHLPFRQIAAELRVSANTVKTQAHAVYRKLDASSRSEAVARATQLGLLDGR